MMVIAKEIDFQIHLILKITCVSIPLECQNNLYRIIGCAASLFGQKSGFHNHTDYNSEKEMRNHPLDAITKGSLTCHIQVVLY
jgi:hypothetical protein